MSHLERRRTLIESHSLDIACSFRHLWILGRGEASPATSGDCRGKPGRKDSFMGIGKAAGAAYRALTGSKDGPSLYDICDPLLLNPTSGDPHLAKFYRTALGNVALRPLLRRAGLAELKDEARLQALRQALIRARDDAAPDWAAIGAPVAALLDTIERPHPAPRPAGPGERAAPPLADIERIIRACGASLLRAFQRNGFIPAHAAFNLIGDPDVGGREFLMEIGRAHV